MASHNHQTTRPDLVERILLRDPPPGHLLSYLDDLFADCDSRDLYLARLLAGAKPQSCYLRQRRSLRSRPGRQRRRSTRRHSGNDRDGGAQLGDLSI